MMTPPLLMKHAGNFIHVPKPKIERRHSFSDQDPVKIDEIIVDVLNHKSIEQSIALDLEESKVPNADAEHMKKYRELIGLPFQNCSICYQQFPDNTVSPDSCSCTFCKECFLTYVSIQVKSRLFPIKCPGCGLDC